ncbi:SLC13 family permease [Pseudoroseomonas cervicalis]|uniref:SLC13 family permease n=1 Tax=Teichococcus cervicalis TaxID=204525 RepID=UPI0027858441|nr:SLC13 family permease [Pseudoroseomonas cervicalis]MDQ1077772.1 di/tricarboxylate transporter [Pseudoroseomonas cervicalis]
MSGDLALVLGLLGLSVLLFLLGRPRMDAVALLMLLALPLSGVLTLPEALSGFSDPSVLLVAALFVIGEGLVRTGIARRLGDWLVRSAGGSETRLIVLLMGIVALLGSVMSSTGVVALFIPVALRAAARLRLAPGRVMMPLSVAALISGMLTLVATAPNLVVDAELRREGLGGFGFFSLTPFGLPILALGILYMLVARRFLGGAAAPELARGGRPSLARLVEDYGLDARARRLRLRPGSPLAGQRLGALRLRQLHGLTILAIERPRRFGSAWLEPVAEAVPQPGDVLLAEWPVPEAALAERCAGLGLEALPLEQEALVAQPSPLGLAEVIVTPDSRLVGRSVLQAGFRDQYGLSVVGLRQGRQAVQQGQLEQVLQTGDTLLLVGPWRHLRRSQRGGRDFLLLNLPPELEEPAPAADRAPQALLAVLVMVALMVSGLVPHLLAALIGCALMAATRCIDLDAAYRAIHWPSLALIIGMLPFSLALQKTGGIALAADGLVRLMGDAGPHAILACLFALTAVTGLFISNTATAVLMAPVAIAAARALDASPLPFAMIVALAASTAFMTPVSSPVNALVLGPGRYRFADFLRIGTPLALLVMALSVLLVPWLLPLR